MTSSTHTHKVPEKQTKIISFIVVGAVLFIGGLLAGSLSGLGQPIRSALSGTSQINTSDMQEMYGMLQRSFDGEVDAGALTNGANTGFAAATGDRFTRYMNPQATTTFFERMQGNGFIGIGVELGVKDNNLTIIAPLPDSPAKQAGIRAGDIILSINNTAVTDMSEEQVVAALRGVRGSSVELTILRQGQILPFHIVREPIITPSVRSSISNDMIGTLTISTFDNNTARLARDAATVFRTAGVRGIVVDMRDNPGGAVTAAQGVLSLWLPKGSTVMTEKRGGAILRTYKTESDPLVNDIPTVILLNGNSASASELVAGALRDYDKAKIIGTRSFGKGSVQEVRLLRSGGSLVLTVSRWFTPNSTSIDGTGILPDITVEQAADSQAQGTDSQLQAARDHLLGA